MKLRIWGTREECETIKKLIKPFMKKIQDNGRFYLNRGSTEVGRMYLDFELDYIIDDNIIDIDTKIETIECKTILIQKEST